MGKEGLHKQDMESFEEMLQGGHPNSLGRTLEVVALVEETPEKVEELYACYRSADEVVRLRTSNALKRLCKAHPEWVAPLIPGLLTEISELDQASAQWTLANLFDLLKSYMTPAQRQQALDIMRRNLANHQDWIVLNNTMQVLFDWSEHEASERAWLLPHLERLGKDERKSVAGRARKLLQKAGI
ncbi:MAG: hypothetical protein AAFV07_05475 [Bacteroidota bacterium]